MGVLIHPEYGLWKPSCNQMGALRLNPYHPANKGLLGWWIFNEWAGDRLRDLKATQNPLTVYNSPTWLPTGMKVTSGSTQYAQGDGAPYNITFTGGWTINVSFTFTAWGDPARFFGRHQDSGGLIRIFAFYISSNEVHFLYSSDGAGYSDSVIVSPLVAGKRYDLTVRVSITNPYVWLDYFVNGVMTAHVSTPSTALYQSTLPICIGTTINNAGAVYAPVVTGVFHGAAIWNRPVPTKEIAGFYANPFGTTRNPRLIVNLARYAAGTGVPDVGGGTLLNPDLRGVLQGCNRGMVI